MLTQYQQNKLEGKANQNIRYQLIEIMRRGLVLYICVLVDLCVSHENEPRAGWKRLDLDFRNYERQEGTIRE